MQACLRREDYIQLLQYRKIVGAIWTASQKMQKKMQIWMPDSREAESSFQIEFAGDLPAKASGGHLDI